MKKIICSFMIIIILFNFILKNVYAETDTSSFKSTITNTPMPASNTVVDDINNNGKVSQKNGSSKKVSTSADSVGDAILGVLLGYVALLIDIIPLQIDLFLGIVTCNTIDTTESIFFTVEKAVFNKIELFNANYFDFSSSYTVGTTNPIQVSKSSVFGEDDANNPNVKIKVNVAKWFAICRLIAIIINLLVLIYIGIRMAISTVASEQAIYKKMLINWFESMLVLFFLQYIMIAIMTFGQTFLNIFSDIEQSIVSSGDESFENTIIDIIYGKLFLFAGAKVMLYSIMFWFLTFIHLKFFWLYAKRFLMIGFLIIISPLVTITYAMDKIKDNRAQAFNNWLKEFTVNILIQPIHAIIYLVFAFTAGKIAAYAPVFALVFLLAMGKVEDIIKTVFNVKQLSSLNAVNHFRKKGK